MNKTITAVFDSVDGATFAARRVASHFGDISAVRVHSGNAAREEGDAHFFQAASMLGGFGAAQSSGAAYPPVGLMMTAGDGGEPESTSMQGRTTVSLTADSRTAGMVAAAMRTCGGWDVRISR